MFVGYFYILDLKVIVYLFQIFKDNWEFLLWMDN